MYCNAVSDLEQRQEVRSRKRLSEAIVEVLEMALKLSPTDVGGQNIILYYQS